PVPALGHRTDDGAYQPRGARDLPGRGQFPGVARRRAAAPGTHRRSAGCARGGRRGRAGVRQGARAARAGHARAPPPRGRGRAVDLDPALEAAELQLGRTLLRLEREAEAQALFEAFVRRKPDRARLAAAAGLYREGSYEAAERTCRDVLATDPDNVAALRLL